MSDSKHQVERIGERIAVNGVLYLQEEIDDLAAKLAPFVTKAAPKSRKKA